ncbi:MAG: sorbosone dehydrogenase family protein [Rhodothermaceae bacterium]|nr:sorbosone dehydrogenase family protein [Rhodothermaceae bacterium]
MRRLLVLWFLLAACTTADDPAAPPSPAQPVALTDTSEAPGAIATVPLTPEPISIRVADLPEPFATSSARQRPNVVDPPDDPVLRVPEGFRVNVWADDLNRPRWLALTPEGDVLLAESRANRIRRLRDTDGDGAADEVTTFADGRNRLDRPFGMAFLGDAFFVGNEGTVRRYPYAPGQARLEGSGEVLVELPSGGHWTRNVIATPEGAALAVAVGSASNVSPEDFPRASVFRINPDGSGRETLGSGLRNPVGLGFHPQTGMLYTTVNERDGLGDDLVPDYFTQVADGVFYGWPYAYLAPDNLDPRRMDGDRSERPVLASQTRTPDVLFQAHSAALGLAFYTGDAFPARYRNGAFVAMRGSWNRSQGTGYKLVFVPFEDEQPLGHYEDFLTGFLIDPSGPTTWGRPVGLLVLPDGSLLFTEEMNGRIYRVSFTDEPPTVER